MPPSIESSVLSITINHNRQRKNLTKRSPYHPCGSYNIGNEQFYQDQVVRTATILPSFYFKGGKLSSFITTSVSGLSSSLQERHLMCCCSSATYSLLGSRNDDVTVQCTETVSMQNKNCCKSHCGNEGSGRPKRKWPGVNGFRSAGSDDSGVRP